MGSLSLQCQNYYSFVEQWSARQSVTLEVAGSNPVGAASRVSIALVSNHKDRYRDGSSRSRTGGLVIAVEGPAVTIEVFKVLAR